VPLGYLSLAGMWNVHGDLDVTLPFKAVGEAVTNVPKHLAGAVTAFTKSAEKLKKYDSFEQLLKARLGGEELWSRIQKVLNGASPDSIDFSSETKDEEITRKDKDAENEQAMADRSTSWRGST
jgi:hypothetical protein